MVSLSRDEDLVRTACKGKGPSCCMDVPEPGSARASIRSVMMV